MTWAVPVAGTAVGTTATTINVPYPSGIAAGDHLVTLIFCRGPGNIPSAPSGWLFTGGGNSNGITSFAKIADGSETGTLAVVTNLAGGNVFGVMIRSSGGHPDVNELYHLHAYQSTAALNLVVPALTITVDGCLVLTWTGKTDNVCPATPPAGFTELVDMNNSGGSVSAFVVAYQIQTTAASIGATVWDVDNDLSDSTATNRGVTLALLPAPASSNTVPPLASFYRMLRNA